MKIIRHASHRKARLSSSWRKPRGLQNKMRLQFKGHRKPLKEGFMSAKATRGKRKGLEVVQVYTAKDFEALDPKVHGIVIGSVGMKKKIALLELVQQHKFTLLTGDPAKAIADLKNKFAERKKESEQKSAERAKKQAEREEKSAKEEKKEALEEKVEEKVEDKKPAAHDQKEKSQEEKDKEKVLTKAR